MPLLHVAFEKSADTMLKRFVKAVCGPYVHTELILTQTASDGATAGPIHTAYSTFLHETFTRIFPKEFWYADDCHDFLHVVANEEELFRIGQACEACAESKVPYNAADMVLSQLPLRNPVESDVYHSRTLFCSQAVVLILRSGLDPTHPLQAPLAAVNSRTVSPSHLFEILRPYCPRRTCAQVLISA
jgi:hypothetical protein